MKKFITLFTDSSREFGKVSTITTAAMCGALSIVMNIMFTVMITDVNKIALYTIPNQMVYYLFGPTVGVFHGAAVDILNYIATPRGSFFPLFTLNSAIAGLLYGMILYKRPLNIWRVLAAELVVVVICNILINSYGLYLMRGSVVIATMPARVIKNIIMWPIKAGLFYGVMKPIEYSGVLRVLKRQGSN